MKLVKVKKTSKEIIEDIKNLSLSEKFESAGIICTMICLLMLLVTLIIASFSKGVVCGLFVTLVSVGIYSIFTGLWVNDIEGTIDFYKTEWVKDE